MYESPITMYMKDIQEQINKQTEEESMIVINQTVGFDVDKEELIKALQYDREQYEKGYRDCKNDILDKVKQAREEIIATNDSTLAIVEILDNLIAESENYYGNKVRKKNI